MAKQQTKSSRNKQYERTPKGFLMRSYRNMLSRVTGVQKTHLHIYLGLPILDKQAFYDWALSSGQFTKLHNAWVLSDYDRTLTPSVDRIDSTKGYLEGNIRWVTNSKNCKLGALSRYSSQTSTTISKLSA